MSALSPQTDEHVAASTGYAAREHVRMAGLIDEFLIPRLQPIWELLSVGCGAGLDVLTLRRRGYRAFGLDPSRLDMKSMPDGEREFFRTGVAEDRPFGKKNFDYVFSFDVIEHVGCKDFGVELNPDAENTRVEFIRACSDAVRPGGRLLLTTSNRLFPIDIGHWHAYHWVGRMFPDRHKLGLSIPWSKANFLVSASRVRKLVEKAVPSRMFRIRLAPVAAYPKLNRQRDAIGATSRATFTAADLPWLRGSVVAPLIAPEIQFLD